MTLAPVALRRVGQEVAEADGDRLRAVVALLDAMEDRGAADRVLEPVRHRLRRLRPSRPLNFVRLLFLPLDPLIVAPAAWKRDPRRVPRSALAPIGTAVRAALGSLADQVIAAAAGRTTLDLAQIEVLGGALWPAAAGALPEAAPANWAETGLTTADYISLRVIIGPLLRNGEALQAAHAAAAQGPPADLVRDALGPLLGAGTVVLQAAIDSLLATATAPAMVADIAVALAPNQRPALVAALEATGEIPLSPLDPDAVADAASIAVLESRRRESLAGCSLLGQDAQRRLQTARHAADRTCRAYAMAALDRTVLGPIRAGAASDEAVEELEGAARDLRRFVQAATRLGGGAEHDRMMRQAADAIAAEAGPGFGPVDQFRLTEILLGPDAAAARFPAER